MACKYFLHGRYPLCTVVRGSMVPSLWELRAYCTSGRETHCPVYQRYEATHAQVPPEAGPALTSVAAAPSSAATRGGLTKG
jgi:hypothetical protein